MSEDLRYTLPSLEKTLKGLELWQFLDQNEKIKPRIYFDSSGVVDMLTGTNSVFRGGVFKSDLYKKPSNLVYALGYQGWLGNIYTLPSHTEELLESLRYNTFLFPKNKVNESKNQTLQLWYKLLETDDLSEVKRLIEENGSKANQETLIALQKEPYHTFLGTYLTQHQNNWKLRYKKLIKEKKIYKYSSGTDSNNKNIPKSELFQKALVILNGKRNKTINNYVDALALCTLDEELKNYDKTNIIPFFFCDQEHIIETAHQLSKQELSDGSRPFIFVDSNSKKEFSIVQEATFFIIEGFIKVMEANEGKKTLNQFNHAIEQIQAFQTNNDEIKRAKDAIKPDINKRIILEFLERWWKDNGSKELIEALALKEEIPNKSLDQIVKTHLEEETQKYQQKVVGFGTRFKISKLAWEDLIKVEDLIGPNKATRLAITINAYDDFGIRFNFSKDACEKIQSWYDNAIDDIKNHHKGGKQDLVLLQSNAISDIIDGLFDDDPEEKENNLEKLIRGIGFFYSFKKFQLVRLVCAEVRKQYERSTKGTNNTDRYPVPSIALIHASTLFLGRPSNSNLENEKEALSIMECVQDKSQGYRTWIGLSYVYNLLWLYRIKGNRFKEQYYSQEEFQKNVISSVGLKHINNAIYYSKKALDQLDSILTDEKQMDPSKHDDRIHRYYYSLNIYLFFNTFYTTPVAFDELKPYAQKLRDISYDGDFFQEGRFSDTLARYYFRSAVLSKNEDHFKLNIKDAIHFCKRSLMSPSNDGVLYKDLELRLERMKVEGFSEAIIMREQFQIEEK